MAALMRRILPKATGMSTVANAADLQGHIFLRVAGLPISRIPSGHPCRLRFAKAYGTVATALDGVDAAAPEARTCAPINRYGWRILFDSEIADKDFEKHTVGFAIFWNPKWGIQEFNCINSDVPCAKGRTRVPNICGKRLLFDVSPSGRATEFRLPFIFKVFV
jgi:hypothetical protein